MRQSWGKTLRSRSMELKPVISCSFESLTILAIWSRNSLLLMPAPQSAGLLRCVETTVAPELRVTVVPAARADGVGVVVAGVTGTVVTGV